MKKLLLIALVCFVSFGAAKAQTRIDVKTKLMQKKKLIYVKAAVRAYLNRSNNFKVVEFREDYQLWITGSSEYTTTDSIYVQAYYKLVKPKLFGKNKVIRAGSLKIHYYRYFVNSSLNYSVFSERIKKDIRKYLIISDFSYATVRGGGDVSAGIKSGFKDITSESVRETGLEPTKKDLIQNTLIGLKSVQRMNLLFGY